MQNFNNYRTVCESEGLVTAHNFNTRIIRHDQLEDGDVLTIPQNVTCFAQTFGNGHTVEFVVFCNQDNELKRVYISWFNQAHGSVIDELEEFCNFEDFFAQNVGRQFKVRITEGEPKENPFGIMIPTKKYTFKWVK